MKKIFALLLALLMLASVLASCASEQVNNDTNPETKPDASANTDVNAKPAAEKAPEKSLKIVTTIFPEYDWVREVLGDQAENDELTMLLDNGVDLHSYQPTADDIVKISDCDLFIYVGGESDGWVDDALKNATNKNMKVINLLEVLGDSVKAEEVVEGMQETEHDHDHDHSKEVSTFEDDEVQDRSLSDWAGDWQSAYPFALDGTLDDAFAAMAEESEMTAKEYKTYYQNGYKTDISNINIEGDHIEFTYEDGKKVASDYKYVGYQNWSTGTKAAMYRFEAVDRTSGAPIYIEFNDHMIEPATAEHFHIRMSNESFDAIVDPENSWPTFFPAGMTGEEICEHMEGHDHDEDEEHKHEEGEEHEHEEEKDEHVWLSLKNAEVLVNAISASLQELDPDNKATYAANSSAYIEKLSALDGEYQAAVDAATYQTVLFGDRFPFRYLVDDYGLSYYAAFVGCSAETEASFETISFLAKKVDELGLPCVLTIEGAQHKIAETIVQNTAEKNQKVLTMDSMQSTTSEDVANGTTYLSVMEQNLSVLKEALD